MTKTVNPADDFMIFDRWDSHQANDGVWIEVADKSENLWGSFKCSLFDVNVPRTKHAMERVDRRSKADKKLRGISSKDEYANIKAGIELALETFLLDWQLKGKSGNPIPFTRENVHAYFGTSRIDPATGEKIYPAYWVLDHVFAQARDPNNFQPDEQDEAPEKN